VSAAPNPPQSRKLDVLVWGATGFTGHLVAEYLTRTYGVGRGLAWGLGGRNRAKLEKVRASLAGIDPAAAGLPLLLGDSADRASLDALARETRVVLTTVGPYALHGAPLVAACVEAATDYCDLTGEPPFIREMIDRHHARAQETGARIVHCCGFDSIPSDLGTLFLQDAMRRGHGAPCDKVTCFASMKGGVSAGTAASMVNLFEAVAHDAEVRRVMADPYSLDPGRTERGPDRLDQLGVRWDASIGRWTGPFVMAAINARVVRRTNALLGYAYGRDFRYGEAMSFRKGPAGFVTAAGMSAGLVGVAGAMAVAPLRRLAAKRLEAASGSGPSKATREAGHFTMRLVGSGAGQTMTATVKGRGDPGYEATSRMLGESAVCLAKDRDATSTRGGVLTPAACMGLRLVERLGRAGFAFEAGGAA
jgi:short subunit dehydrogenase-like uncharacterized protein